MAEPAHFEKSIFSPDRIEPAEHPPSKLIAPSLDELSASGCVQTNLRVPLPLRSVALQTYFNNYLDTWPSPGATVSADRRRSDGRLVNKILKENSHPEGSSARGIAFENQKGRLSQASVCPAGAAVMKYISK
jgi:hypothetical protein